MQNVETQSKTKRQVHEMTRAMFTRKGVPNYVEVTNLEHREMIELKSILELIDWLDELFMLRREGEDGYGELVCIC
jgi:hypothetical protein